MSDPLICAHLSWKRRGLPLCFWIRALSTQQGGYVRATNLIIIIIIIIT